MSNPKKRSKFSSRSSMNASSAPLIPQKTRTHLEWPKILERFAEQCRGPVAKQHALDWKFSQNEDELRLRLQEVDEARSILDQGHSPPIGQIHEIERAVLRANRGGVLEIEELLRVGRVLESAHQVLRFFKEHGQSSLHLSELSETLLSEQALARDLLTSFTPEGEIHDHASGELGFLRDRVNSLHGQLKNQIASLVTDETYSPMLQDEFYTIREDRYVLPIKSGHKRHVEGIVHGWSTSGATVFIEPKPVMEANNRLMMAQAEVKKEIYRILSKLSKQIGRLSQEILHSFEILVHLDLVFARGQFSKELRATSPIITLEPQLKLEQARHPLLMLSGVKVVPNLIQLGTQANTLVITGPNAGGKTVVMKTAGLLVLMALAGFHIPAEEGALIPWVPGVFSDMGDEQDLSEGHSTFSGHMMNLKKIFNQVRPHSLVLLDELAIGTDPLQGSALAQAILEHFSHLKTLTFVTTHYESLKLLPNENDDFRNGAVEYDDLQGRPTYRLQYDIPGSSSALQIARRFGLPSDLLERAQTLTGEQHQKLEKTILQMEQEISLARKAKKESDRQAQMLRIKTSSVESLEAKLKIRLKRGVEHERSQALREIKRLRDRLSRLKEKLQTQELTADDLQNEDDQLKQNVEQIQNDQLNDRLEDHPQDLDLSSLSVGQKVWSMALNTEVELVSTPDHKGQCQIKAGLLSMSSNVSTLRKLKAKKKKTKTQASKPVVLTKPKVKRSAPTWEGELIQTSDNTCDVRGKRGDEAIDIIVPFLDILYGQGHKAAFIIHGHGTGALRRHLRSWFPSCDYIHDFRRGEPSEGGNGVSVVLLTHRSI